MGSHGGTTPEGQLAVLRYAIAIALHICGPADLREARLVRIKNTLKLERIRVSVSLLKVVMGDPELRKKIEVIGKPIEMQFDIL